MSHVIHHKFRPCDRLGLYSAVTRMETNPATAVITTIGVNTQANSAARDELRRKIAGIIKFD